MKDSDKLLNLINSGVKENIELAFQLHKSNGIPLDLWAWSELAEWLYKYRLIKSYKSLEEAIVKIFDIREVYVTSDLLENITEHIGLMVGLECISFISKKVTTLPDSISKLTHLKYIILYGCNIKTLPKSMSMLTNLVSIDMDSNGMKDLPSEVCDIPNLENLEIRFNDLTTLPKNIGNLKKLKKLKLQGNKMAVLPKSICMLQSLKGLMANDTYITIDELVPDQDVILLC